MKSPLIVKWRYWDNKTVSSGRAGKYLAYIGIRDGVEMLDTTYLDYIGTRPGVERQTDHGLFSDEGISLVLSTEREKLKAHKGRVMTLILSLSREDAEATGFNCAERWCSLMRTQKLELARHFGIPPEALRWYGAFHNAETHPQRRHPRRAVAECGVLFFSQFHRPRRHALDARCEPDHRGSHQRSAGTPPRAGGRQQAEYASHHDGTSEWLFVFEAPIDMLAFLTLHRENWRAHAYVALCSVSERALLHRLKVNPKLSKIVLCLDNDHAGRAATVRITAILHELGYTDVRVHFPRNKDWDDDLRAGRGSK